MVGPATTVTSGRDVCASTPLVNRNRRMAAVPAAVTGTSGRQRRPATRRSRRSVKTPTDSVAVLPAPIGPLCMVDGPGAARGRREGRPHHHDGDHFTHEGQVRSGPSATQNQGDSRRLCDGTTVHSRRAGHRLRNIARPERAAGGRQRDQRAGSVRLTGHGAAGAPQGWVRSDCPFSSVVHRTLRRGLARLGPLAIS